MRTPTSLFSGNLLIASDHGGYPLKQLLINSLPELKWNDLGPQDSASVDYPDYADKLCKVLELQEKSAHSESGKSAGGKSSLTFGVLICGSGQGMAIRANRFPFVRAALCWDRTVAELARSHNNANVLCLGARVIAPGLALQILETFLTTPFEGGRHQARVDKLCSSTTSL